MALINQFVADFVDGHNIFAQDAEFQQIIQEAEMALAEQVNPELAYLGSSGTYFIKDRQGIKIGVFKPKDEEPFAPLNPRWSKCFQRVCCPCSFGRTCLLPNHGYLSEVGACIIDQIIQINVVPKTKIVSLKSKAFYNPTGRHIPYKRGSFQLFVDGYEDAGVWLEQVANQEIQLNEREENEFTDLAHKMMVLDYIIRNTDRSDQNWLIRYDDNQHNIQIAVIDNGLSFPVKHPLQESWLRPFKFYWANLDIAKRPFSDQLRQHLLENLDDANIRKMSRNLKKLYQTDDTYNRTLFYNQMRVLRGQIYNLKLTLEDVEERNRCPAQMALKRPVLVKSDGRIKHIETASTCVIM